MLRNRELRIMLIMMAIIAITGIAVIFLINALAGVIALITVMGVSGITVIYTIKRYKDINKLSVYLKKVYGGEYSLDIRDNMEGELSILKNEIYKVNSILSMQAEQLKVEKEQLAGAISDISHQLKTPLTSMLVMTDLLNTEELEQDKRMLFTRNMTLQLKRMEWLLTSLLKIAKIDAGTIEFKKEQVNVEKLIKHSIKPLLIPMELKNQEFIVSGETTVSFDGDFNWSSEALINIIKNCIEHTPDGGRISVYYSENPMYTEIAISDNGRGIDKKDLPYIFKRFYKGKNASEDSVGIGLAMAKSIINSQNGDIVVSSTINQGTSFHIKFFKQVV